MNIPEVSLILSLKSSHNNLLQHLVKYSSFFDIFFNKTNICYLQTSIRNNVYTKSGYSIGPQNEQDLQLIMGKYYSDYRYNDEENIEEQKTSMNSGVIGAATKMIVSAISSSLSYLNDISKRPTPMDLPQNTSIYGTNLQRR